MKLIVGIDFGTSTTVVRYRMEDSDTIQALKDANGQSDVIPTVIFRNTECGTTVYGVQALNAAMSSIKDKPIMNFKMDLLNPAKREEAKGYIEEFMKYIYSLFREQTLSLSPTQTVINISYPAKWDDTMVKIMKEAVANAGFEGEINGKKEPEAATRNLLHIHLQELQRARLLEPGKSLRILMLDMGAGTTDISIFKLSIGMDGVPNITELLSYPSKEETILCGGREIDAALRQYILDYCKQRGFDLIPDCVELPFVKQWKETVVSPYLKEQRSVGLLPSVGVALKYGKREDIFQGFSLKRAEFEQVTHDHWEKLYHLIKSAMAQYRYAQPEDIDFICFTGGHSAWYTLPKLFNGDGVCGNIAIEGKDPEALNFKKQKEEPWRMSVVTDYLPHESVARGLCLMDQKIVYSCPSSNNVWVRIIINDQQGEIVQVVNKFDDILPVEKDVEHGIKVLRNYLLETMKVDAQIDIYIGETLEHAEHRTMRLSQDNGSIIFRLIRLFSLYPLFVPYVDTKIRMKIRMTDEGILEIDGEFWLDKKMLSFSFEDLITVNENKIIN